MKAHNLQVTGSLTTGGEAIGSISSSVATTTLGLGSRITTIEGKSLVSGSGQIPSLLPSGVVSGSAQTISNLPSGTVSGSAQVDVMSTTNIARLATTGSNTFQGLQTVNGSLVVTGSLTAQQFIVSSSVTYLTESFASGSHKFGDSSDDNHNFTGSVYVTGSVTINKQNEGLILSSGINTDASYLSTRANNSTGWMIIGSQGTTANYIQTGAAANESAITTVGAYALSIGTNQTERIKVTSAGQTQFSTNTNGGNIRLSSNGTAMEMYNTSGTVKNWQISSQVVNSMCMDFTPSTTNGGTTYSTPVLTIDGEQNRVGINTGTSRPLYPLDMTTSSSGTFNTIVQFQNTDYTAGNRSFLRVRAWASAGGSYSSYFGTGQDGNLYMIANNSARGGDLIINAGTGAVTMSSNLSINGRLYGANGIINSNLVAGNIASNMPSAPAYILLVDLNVAAGFSLSGKVNAASYTCWNVSDVYIRKDYSSLSGQAVITGVAKSGCDFSVVDITYNSGRYIALRFTSNPEIDVLWTGYRLTDQVSGGSFQVITAGVTVNSTYASY